MYKVIWFWIKLCIRADESLKGEHMQPRMGGIIQANISDIETLYCTVICHLLGAVAYLFPHNEPVKIG